MQETDGDLILADLLRRVIANRSDESLMLRWMHVIHTRDIELNEPAVLDGWERTVIRGATQRVAALTIAQLWHDQADVERSNYVFWYRKYALSEFSRPVISAKENARIAELCGVLESDPMVKSVALASD
jgi:hypothetical protein